ncbi:YlbL family protein [Nocardioides rubriscoriae]|uniref:YlbL family protein n=1 Tax=Nocardioides rubriscoriae TaxID=642762 RepID=UPI0011DF6712|nr:S16 family serine protease [Nocardioides rubriscoriae]
MSQRLIAAVIAIPAVIALFVYAWTSPLPYAYYQPGTTIDVLGTDGADAEVIQVDGATTYPDDGQLRMTTVQVSPAAVKGEKGGESLVDLISTWANPDNAVYPYDVVHPDGETLESNREEGQLQMATSQDAAVEVALSEMGIDVPQVLAITALTPGKPAEKVLEVDDVIRTVAGTKVDDAGQLVKLISDSPAGRPLTVGITRDGKDLDVSVVPVTEGGRSLIGITPEVAEYKFPFDVKININPNIGGPSAGLIFSLAVYDTLTEGSLTGGHEIAGTGEIAPDGTVGPIGGIQQKIAGARDDGAELFLVPIDNCADALGADNGDMRLVMAQTMHDVRQALEKYAADDDPADLPSCEDAAAILSGAAS